MLIEDTDRQNLVGNDLKNYRRKKKILTLLYKKDTLSATNIGREIGVSLPTSLALLKELSNERLVEYRGTGKSKGGRRPKLFGLRNDSLFVISCELGHRSGKVGVYDSHNQLVAPAVNIITNIDDPEFVEKIYAAAQSIVKEAGLDENTVVAMGVAMPGLVDSEKGINYTIKNKGFRNVGERLSEKFGKLVYVNNDARMQAYGEFIFGTAKGYDNALILNWNWGLGVGLILGGKLYDGATGFAGELSHTKFEEDGELCVCGKRGCLETVISARVLVQKTKEAIAGGKISQLTNKFKDCIEELCPQDIIDVAKCGDEFAISLLNTVGLALGKALSNTIQLLNPGIIVLGGMVSQANQYVLTPIQQSINQHCLEQVANSTKIVISDDWEQSGLKGMTAKLFQELFSDMDE